MATYDYTTESKKKPSSKSTVSASQKAVGIKVPKADCDIDNFGTLTAYKGSAKAIILPDGISAIGKHAFNQNESITSVVIQEGVETIGDSAFICCCNLQVVELPNSLRKIGDNAFYECEKLTSIIIPEGVETIEGIAFGYCHNLEMVVLPNSLRRISDSAFVECEKLTSIIIPEGVETIEDGAFGRCRNLEAVALPNSLRKIGDSAFGGCEQLTSIIIPEGVETIKDGTFRGCCNLEMVALPNFLRKIGNRAFWGCEKLTSIIIPEGVKTFGNSAFGLCCNLERIELPNSLRKIGNSAFQGCKKLTSIIIPEGAETIGDRAFGDCLNLEVVEFPNSLRKISDNAFFLCAKLTSIIIPEGCKKIGANAFAFCNSLSDIYVPDSVYEIGDDAFCSFNYATVIHTTRGSEAERFADENNLSVDYKAAPSGSVSTSSAKRSTSSAKAKTKVESDAESLDGTMDDLSSQIAELESQQLSAEDQEKLEGIKGLMNDLGNQLAESQVGLSKYGDYLEQKEAREKAMEEGKASKKEEAKAAGRSEKDIVNMYIILTNEKKLGKLHRAQEEFYEIYEEDFAALSKSEVIQMRKDMLKEMEDESLCSYYAESFRRRSVEDRFSVSTRNLSNVSENTELGEKAEWAIENTKEWYTPSEYAEVRRMMDADLADTRKQLDDQLKLVDDAWTKYSTGKDSLQIVITDKAEDDSNMELNASNFQVVIGSQLVSVQIATKGIFRMSATVTNCFTWYWGVTVKDVWEAAKRNELRDEREGAYNGAQLAEQALNQIRSKYTAPKVTTTASNYPRTSPAQNHATSTAAASSFTANSNIQKSNTSTAISQQTQPAKKEGCYIATAVYGSYDALEVMTLRRFRDEKLRKSAFGRWFIRTYYRLSPPVAEKLKNAKHINALVRAILNKWVKKLNRKQR